MKTEDLITALAQDGPQAPRRQSTVVAWLAVVAAVVAFAVFWVTLGPRPDIAAAATTVRFLFKFVVTIALAGSALWLLNRLLRPGAQRPQDLWVLLVAPVLIVSGVVVELFSISPELWLSTAKGRNSMVCLTYVPLIGLGPLVLMMVAVRHGAATRPVLTGAVTGLFAGGLAATFYAAQCVDDSPLFVVVWYTIAIAGLTLLGAVLGKLAARW